MHVRKEFGWMVLLLIAAPVLSGCDEPVSASASPAPIANVSVITVSPEPHALVRELPGRIAPTRVAEVRPQVSGIIVQRLFERDRHVFVGDPLERPQDALLVVESGARVEPRASQDATAAGAPAPAPDTTPSNGAATKPR